MLACTTLLQSPRFRWHDRLHEYQCLRRSPKPLATRSSTVLFAAESSQTVIERRAADVLVLGSGPLAYSAAYSLARSGQKVILLEDYGMEQQPLPRPTPQPLVLMHTQPHQVHLAKEAAAYWRGLQMMSGAAMLRSCPSIAFGAGGSSSAAAEKLQRIQDACAEAGEKLALLASSETSSKFSSIRLPNGYTTLLHEQGGGILLPVEVDAALTVLCQQSGVVVRDNLVLRGWRDAGDHFVAKASSRVMPDVMSVFEAERLLLAPGHWAPSCWSLFHFSSQLSTVQVASTRVAAGSDMLKAPVWHYIGDELSTASTSSTTAASTAGLGAAAAFSSTSEQPGLPSCYGLPLMAEGGKVTLCQSSQLGRRLEGPGSYQQLPDAEQLAAAALVHGAAAQHVRGLQGWQQASSSCQLMHGTEDGLPVVDYHPGFEAGRVVVAATAGSTSPGIGLGHSGYQLSPIVAKAAADLLRGSSCADVELAALGLSRAAVQGSSSAAAAGVDTWEGLWQVQQGARDVVSDEERQDLAADARADERESRLLGTQFFGLQ